MKEKPNKWLIALFFGLGTMLNIPLLLFGGVFRLGAIPIFIGAYFAAKGVQHLRRKKKINKKFPGNLSYNRNLLAPDIRNNFEKIRGYEAAIIDYADWCASDLSINPAWKKDIIEDYMQPLSK